MVLGTTFAIPIPNYDSGRLDSQRFRDASLQDTHSISAPLPIPKACPATTEPHMKILDNHKKKKNTHRSSGSSIRPLSSLDSLPAFSDVSSSTESSLSSSLSGQDDDDEHPHPHQQRRARMRRRRQQQQRQRQCRGNGTTPTTAVANNYAGPSFSSNAPEPRSLPHPTFLTPPPSPSSSLPLNYQYHPPSHNNTVLVNNHSPPVIPVKLATSHSLVEPCDSMLTEIQQCLCSALKLGSDR